MTAMFHTRPPRFTPNGHRMMISPLTSHTAMTDAGRQRRAQRAERSAK